MDRYETSESKKANRTTSEEIITNGSFFELNLEKIYEPYKNDTPHSSAARYLEYFLILEIKSRVSFSKQTLGNETQERFNIKKFYEHLF